jgi:succinyl-CoA synthetase beta subunit
VRSPSRARGPFCHTICLPLPPIALLPSFISQVTHAFEILNSDSRVQAILVNIFGGIMRCDVIAQGVIAAAKKIGLRKPVVLRLQGTNVKEAKALIEASGYRIIVVDDLDKAAETAVRIAEIKRQAEEVSLNVSFELPL